MEYPRLRSPKPKSHRKKSKPETRRILSISRNSQNSFSKEFTESYKGVKSECSSSFDSDDFLSNDKKESKRKVSEVTVPTLFEWKEGGNVVLLTGSFCNWNERFMMEKNYKTNNFEYTLDLPIGQYEYKFIVDNKFRYSSWAKCTKDENGNRINYIDNTKNYIVGLDENENKNKKNKLYKNEVRRGGILVKKKQRKKDYSDKKEELEILNIYGNKFPSKNFFDLDPPNLPLLYTVYFNMNLNTRQNQLGNRRYLQNRKISMNESFKNIRDPKHIYLNHLLIQTKIIGLSNICNKNKQLLSKKSSDSSFESHSENSEDNSDILETHYQSKSLRYHNSQKTNKIIFDSRTCISSNIAVRIRSKYSSVIYYQPIKNKYYSTANLYIY